MSDAVVATDMHSRVTFANPAAQKLYGIAEEDALGRGLLELLDMFDTGGHADVDDITHIVAHEGCCNGELTERALDGREFLVEAPVSLLTDDDGAVLGSVSILREISGRKAAERQISFQATHNGLTGLLNTTAFLAELETSLAAGRRPTHASIEFLLEAHDTTEVAGFDSHSHPTHLRSVWQSDLRAEGSTVPCTATDSELLAALDCDPFVTTGPVLGR